MMALNPGQVKDLLENANPLLINTLDEDHFPSTKIPGAVNIPQNDDDFVRRVKSEAESKDATVVVYCANEECGSSTEAADKLEAAGFKLVCDMEAGAAGWKDAGFELE